MNLCPTVKIKGIVEGEKYRIINEADFNAKEHELFVEDAEADEAGDDDKPALTPKPAKPPKKAAK